MESNNWTPYFINLSWQIPTCLLALVGVVLAIINLGRHTLPAMLALIAFGLQLINHFIIAGTMAWHMQVIPHEVGNRGEPVLTLLNVVWTFLAILSQILILCAIFGWRKTPPAKPNT